MELHLFILLLTAISRRSPPRMPQKVFLLRDYFFVPYISSQDSCNNVTVPFIPANVTRHQGVTPFGYHTIGLAPWITLNCSRSFLGASRRVGTEALVFFLPASDDAKLLPPANSKWLLHGGSFWESENMYPVYAIPGPAGIDLMEQLSWCSNSRTLPQGQNNESAVLSQNESWNMRLFSVIDLEKHGRKTSGTWGFLLAILGTILVICLILLILYQLLQRRRRENLQRQLEAGTVERQPYDLRHFRVPRDFLAGLPLYVYPGLDDPEKHNSLDNVGEAVTEGMEAEIGRRSKSTYNELLSHPQTTCAICLDDFIPALSTVRELPCAHIYHPECIDVSFTQTSSLFPPCKKSVLAPEFFPISTPDVVYGRDGMRDT
ncbi:hypothetical protein BDW66DRAFT_168526 [Aspergillus desertorum]